MKYHSVLFTDSTDHQPFLWRVVSVCMKFVKMCGCNKNVQKQLGRDGRDTRIQLPNTSIVSNTYTYEFVILITIGHTSRIHTDDNLVIM